MPALLLLDSTSVSFSTEGLCRQRFLDFFLFFSHLIPLYILVFILISFLPPFLYPDFFSPTADENPCSASGCSHICILSSYDVRGFTCACEEGVELLEDQLTCKGIYT